MKTKNLFQLILIQLVFTLTLFASEKLSLSAEESAWIKNNTHIKVGGETDWPPFDFVDKQGEYQGISKDFMELISLKTGLQFEYITGQTWKELLNSFQEGKLDILPAIYKTSKREEFTLFTDSYFSVKDYVFVRSDDTSIVSLEDLREKKVAIIDGYAIEEQLKKRFPNINFIRVQNKMEGINAVLLYKADLYIDGYGVMLHTIKSDFISGIKPILPLDFYSNKLYIGINKEQKILASIIQKALKSITAKERNEIINKWLFQEMLKEESSLDLTKEERKWLQDHKTIRVLNEIDWPPYDFDINGKAVGYSIEYIEELAKLIGVELEFVKGQWSELLEKFENKQIDIIHVFNKTKQREENYLFTKPYITPSYAITIRKEDRSIQKVDDLVGKKVACGKGWSSTKVFKEHYPNSIVVEYENISEMLKALSYGEVDAALDDLASTYYQIVKDKRVNLKIAFEIDTSEDGKDQNYYLAVHKEDQPLQTLLNKALNAMPSKTLLELNKKWFGENTQVVKKIGFSEQEKIWLKQKPVIRYSEVNWKPLSIIENSSMTGIMGDYLKLISLYTGIEFEFVPSKSWPDVLEKFKFGQIDLVPGIGNTPEELSLGAVSKKYATFPMVIVTNDTIQYISSLNDIKEKRFALPKYYTSYNYIKTFIQKLKYLKPIISLKHF